MRTCRTSFVSKIRTWRTHIDSKTSPWTLSENRTAVCLGDQHISRDTMTTFDDGKSWKLSSRTCFFTGYDSRILTSKMVISHSWYRYCQFLFSEKQANTTHMSITLDSESEKHTETRPSAPACDTETTVRVDFDKTIDSYMRVSPYCCI
jgi:5-methylcytosine-specific restriction endonuclease McrA